MDRHSLKKALFCGIPAGIAAWFFYGLFTSLFDDDSITEQMFDSSGILFMITMVILGVVLFDRRGTKEEAKES